jgi:hypothetical protein
MTANSSRRRRRHSITGGRSSAGVAIRVPFDRKPGGLDGPGGWWIASEEKLRRYHQAGFRITGSSIRSIER